MDFLQNIYFLIALTFGFYLGAQLIQRRTGIKLLNPILIAIAAMIAFLLLCDIDYDTYKQGGDYIDFWLKPAVVALGVPLYKQLSAIKRQLLPLLLSELGRCGERGASCRDVRRYPRSGHLARPQGCHYPYCHGNIKCDGRYRSSYGCGGCGYRNFWGHGRF